jgi:hypothetical protein
MKPTKEQKLAAWRFMKKHALPKMQTEQSKKVS